QSALRAPRGGGGDSFGFVALSGPNSKAGWWHQANTPAFVRSRGTSGQDRRHTAHFHRFRVPLGGMTTLNPVVKRAMEEAFGVVLDAFRDVTLNESAVLESVGRQVHRVTGGQMREFAGRLRDAAPRPLTEEQILEWADDHHNRKGEWPGVQSGTILA